MKRKIAQGTAALLFAGAALLVIVVTLQLMSRGSGPNSTEGQALNEMSANGVMFAVGMMLLLLLVGVGFGTVKLPKPLRAPVVLAGFALAAVLFVVGGGAMLRARETWKGSQEVELARQRSAEDAARQFVKILGDSNPRYRQPLQTADTDEFIELAGRVVVTDPMSATEAAVIESILASQYLTPTAVITSPLLLLQEIGKMRDYSAEGVWESAGVIPVNHPTLTGITLHKYQVTGVTLVNGDPYEIPGGWAIIAVRQVVCVQCGDLLGPSYLVAGVFVLR